MEGEEIEGIGTYKGGRENVYRIKETTLKSAYTIPFRPNVIYLSRNKRIRFYN